MSVLLWFGIAFIGLLSVVVVPAFAVAGLLWLVSRYLGRILGALLAIVLLAPITLLWVDDIHKCGLIGVLPPAASYDAACEGPAGGVGYFFADPIFIPAGLVLLTFLEIWIFRRNPRRRARTPKFS
jgi:hypothetical protein